jgi:predicted amidophosphoribosyltransferase
MLYKPGDLVRLKSSRVRRICSNCGLGFYTQAPNYCHVCGTKLSPEVYYPEGEIVHARHVVSKKLSEITYTISGSNGIQYSLNESELEKIE